MILKENKDPKKLETVREIERVFLKKVLRDSGSWQTTLCERHIRWANATLHIDIVPAVVNGATDGDGEPNANANDSD